MSKSKKQQPEGRSRTPEPALHDGLRAAAVFCLIATAVAAAVLARASAQSPAKEYIYVGGRLVATEEPSVSLPAAPVNARLTIVSSSEAFLFWDDASANETGFKIERRPSSGTAWTHVTTTAPDVNSYMVGTFGCGYTYRVKATNQAGDSAYSNEASTTTGCWVAATREEPVVWKNVVGVQATGNSLRKVTGTNAWDSGAVSTRAIGSGDGYAEFTVDNAVTWRMCGLGNSDGGQFYTDIEYDFFLNGGGGLHVYEAEFHRGQFGTYAAGDRLRVAVEGGSVKYYRNGTLLHMSGVTPSYPLLVDTSLNTVNSDITGAVIAARPESFVGVGAPENVFWTNVTSTVTVTGNSIQKTSGTNNWYDAGAVSSRTIASGDGYVEFTPGETQTWRICGLGNGDSSAYYADVEYAFFLDGGGGLHVYEAGVYRGQFGTYSAGDRLRVAVEGGAVKYYRNATLLYTSGVTPSYPLLVDTSLNTVNAGVYSVKIAGALTP